MPETASPTAQRVAKAIRDGSISAKQLVELKTALAECRNVLGPQPAPASAPTSEYMRKPAAPAMTQRQRDNLFCDLQHEPGAFDAAMRFAAEWDELKAHRATSLGRDRYVELSLADWRKRQ